MKISECSFRDIDKKCVILKGEHVYSGAKKHMEERSYQAPVGVDATLCYCYIDAMAGLSFHFLCFANFITGKIDTECYERVLDAGTILIFRAGPDYDVSIFAGDTSLFHMRVEMVDESYYRDKNVLATRDITLIDQLRNTCYPDDILALLYKDGLEPERPWVRLQKIENNRLYGILLNEPHQDFGISFYDNVTMDFLRHADEVYAVICISS